MIGNFGTSNFLSPMLLNRAPDDHDCRSLNRNHSFTHRLE